MILIEINLLGRLHPLVIHFPIGLLIGVLLVETWNKWRKISVDYRGLIYLGAFSTLISAVFGFVLRESEAYSGTLVTQHQWSGFLASFVACITALAYYWQAKLPADLPYYLLWFNALILGFTAHLGGSITHGEGYLLEAFQPNTSTKYAFDSFASMDTLDGESLDRLSLEVRAIFAHNCYQCHSTAKRKGDLALDHAEGVFAGGKQGPILVKGEASNSEIIRRLRLPRDHDDAMPTKGKGLPESEIKLIELWINQGAHWAADSLKVFREAPLALTKPQLPISNPQIKNPIDRWVDVYFQQNKIKWPKVVDDRKFIRRAYLDIIGLLPEHHSVEAFIANKDPDKRSQLIDQLLKDKENYALHWLSFWNDLLRNDYTGTGYITGGRKQITEWLYQAIYEQLPYDQMVKALVDPSPESEGFIKGIKWRGVVNSSQRTELQAAQNISQSLLGVNLKCASCHNSFINNLTLDQAYGFANVFSNEPLEIYRCDKPTGRMAQMAFLYPELGEINGDSLEDRLSQLAQIMVQPQNGRLYRTIVNRFWDRLFGRGIVAPVDEMDNLPWSSELLDWLASDFIEQGYDFHRLLKLMMTSKAYQLAAVSYPSNEYLSGSSFVFRGPSIRRLTTEQFVDVFGQVLTPIYHSVAFNPDPQEVHAKWIWHEEIKLDRRVLPNPGARLFRKRFKLDKPTSIIQASVLITADHAFELNINEEFLAKGDEWWQVDQVDIPVDMLKSENVIALKASNEGVIPNPAGLLFQLQIQYSDSTIVEIVSDRSWITTADTLVQGWKSLEFDDKDWDKAWQAGSFQKSYWGQLLDFTFDNKHSNLKIARASLVQQDDFMKTLGRPVRENVITNRNPDNTLLKALLITNSTLFHEHISKGAKILQEETSSEVEILIDRLYQSILSRPPTRKERRLLQEALNQEDQLAALEDVIWTMFLLPEFQFI